MKRLGLGFLGAALLLILLPLTLSSCAITCACTTPPAPGTPLPISADQAAANADKVAGATGMTAEYGGILDWTPYYRASSGGTIAYVDAVSGAVFDVILIDQMPNDAAASPTRAGAQTAAKAFMAQTGLSTNGLTESAALKTVAEVSAYDVT